jgi:hypothetical protein
LQKLDRVLGEALKVARLMREPAVVVGTHPDDGQAGEATVGSCPEARDRLLLPCVLGETGGKQAPAALLLGITRRTPRTKPRALGLHGTRSAAANERDLPKPHRVPPRHAHQSRLETAWARDLCDRRARTFFTNRAIRDHLRAFPRQAAGALRTIRPA